MILIALKAVVVIYEHIKTSFFGTGLFNAFHQEYSDGTGL